MNPASNVIKLENMSLSVLPCDFPLRPINETVCSDQTYAEYMNSQNSSLLVSTIWFAIFPGVTMSIFFYRAYYNTNLDQRITLLMFGYCAFALFINCFDPNALAGIVPLFVNQLSVDYQGATAYILALRYSYGWRKTVQMKTSPKVETFLVNLKNFVIFFLYASMPFTEFYTVIMHDTYVGQYHGVGVAMNQFVHAFGAISCGLLVSRIHIACLLASQVKSCFQDSIK